MKKSVILLILVFVVSFSACQTKQNSDAANNQGTGVDIAVDNDGNASINAGEGVSVEADEKGNVSINAGNDVSVEAGSDGSVSVSVADGADADTQALFEKAFIMDGNKIDESSIASVIEYTITDKTFSEVKSFVLQGIETIGGSAISVIDDEDGEYSFNGTYGDAQNLIISIETIDDGVVVSVVY